MRGVVPPADVGRVPAAELPPPVGQESRDPRLAAPPRRTGRGSVVSEHAVKGPLAHEARGGMSLAGQARVSVKRANRLNPSGSGARSSEQLGCAERLLSGESGHYLSHGIEKCSHAVYSVLRLAMTHGPPRTTPARDWTGHQVESATGRSVLSRAQDFVASPEATVPCPGDNHIVS